jgi:serine/threonine-protein kinase RsbT
MRGLSMENYRKNKVSINSEGDIVGVRKVVRETATEIGFGVTDVTRIVTAASELARNVYRFAGTGAMYYEVKDNGEKQGIVLIFEDSGPGIENVDLAFEEGYTTGGGLGLGLPGTKRLMDEMEIQSESGRGTKVMVAKWLT